MADAPSDAPKRFYKIAAAATAEGGFAVTLDGRSIRTPKRERLILPNLALAALIADEWAGQGETIHLAGMRATRLAYTAADRVSVTRAETVAEVVRFAGSDLLCYFAEAPRALVQRQQAQWTPLLDWAERALGVRLNPVAGIIHAAQPAESLTRIETLCAETDDFTLAGLTYATALYGSAVLALAVLHGEVTGEQAYEVSRLDEAFQQEQWGVDDEAAARTAHGRLDAAMLQAWFAALRT